jgi:hypothetical protein
MNRSFTIESDRSIDSSDAEARLDEELTRLEDVFSNDESLLGSLRRIWTECRRLVGDDAPAIADLLVSEADRTKNAFDMSLANALTELWNEEPGVVIDMASASLQRSAEMMQDIVDETKSELIDIARHREEIDRKQAATRAILEEAMARLK